MLLLAHRGLPAPDRPENSLAAVDAAFTTGADGVELDVRLTSDGVLALVHDPDLRRLTGVPITVGDNTWTCLRETAGERDVRLASADQALVLANGRRVVLELKKPPPAPAAAARTALAVAGQLRSLQRAGVPMDVTVSSFSVTVAAHVRRLLPPGCGVRTALLGRPLTRPSALLRQALAAGHDEVHPHVMALLAAPESISTAHALGVAVCPYTVNRRRDVRRLAKHGVDMVITDVPVSARLALAAARKAAA